MPKQFEFYKFLFYGRMLAYLTKINAFIKRAHLSLNMLFFHYRKSFNFYTKNNLLSISLYYAVVSNYLISYILYSINIYLFFFYPIVALLFPYYFILSFNNNSEVQNPEKLHKNKILLFTIVMITLIFTFLYILKSK